MRERVLVCGVCVCVCVHTHMCVFIIYACLNASAAIVCFVLVENAAYDYKAL